MEKIKYRIGISIGDFNGVGVEVILKTLTDARITDICTPVIYGSGKVISYYRKALDIQLNYHQVKDVAQMNPRSINVVNCWEEEVALQPGQPSTDAGSYALKSLIKATDDLAQGKIDGLATAPINKNTIQSDHFNFSGHTEFFTDKFKVEESLMLMVCGSLRIGLVTNHVAIRQVAEKVTTSLVLKKINLLNKTLTEDFGIVKPKIAILGLNPHAGDEGLLGTEENAEIKPAIFKAKENKMLVMGPFSADGFFGSGSYKGFDGILAMYHDQGLVPFKTLSFGSGVNYTAGLPVVRTSPDHGTAYNIAGKNVASEDSFREAIFLALDIIRNRAQHKENTANPLKKAALSKEMY